MNLSPSFLCCFFFLGLNTLHGQNSDWDKALELDSTGKHAQAIKLLDRLVDDPAMRLKALLMRSRIRFDDLHQAEAAFEDIGMAMQFAPDSLGPYVNRGSMYMNLGMPDRAIEDFRTGLKKSHTAGDSATLNLNLGSALGMVRRFEEAITALDAAIAQKEDNWPALMNKATMLDEVGRTDEAHAILVKLHEAQPENAVILNNLGFSSSKAEDHKGAIHWFTKALALKPSDAVILNNLGFAQFQAGEVDAALDNVQKSIKGYPGNSYAYRNLGIILQAKGQQDKACEAFESALQRNFTEQYGPEVDQLRRKNCH
ncbi:MAG: tetratricopeptide repeat protein [Flavobacteriales bacterium]|nr:tetratricopeptide repeat protein [Flavobacteriales bacterium]